jgi:hypothetical protein
MVYFKVLSQHLLQRLRKKQGNPTILSRFKLYAVQVQRGVMLLHPSAQ